MSEELIVKPRYDLGRWELFPKAPREYRNRLKAALASIKLAVFALEQCESDQERLEFAQLIERATDNVIHQLDWVEAVAGISEREMQPPGKRIMTKRLSGD